jgi:hypothetical protein
MKRLVKTYEEYIGDKAKQMTVHRKRTVNGEEVSSINTNTAGRHYDQEADGSDQINRSAYLGTRGYK